MHNFVTNFAKILEISKQFAGNQVNEKGNVTYRLNQKNRTKPTWAYKRLRKRREAVFSKLNDHIMMIRNYAKLPAGLFARMAAKVAAFTMLQYFNILNNKPIGQVKYELF